MTLAFTQTGDGPPLVLVHGVGATRAIWGRVLERLASDHAVIALDLPGFGDSPPAGPAFDLDEVADAVAEGLAAAGVPIPFELVGHSLGGAVALTLAHRHPDMVGRLVLVAPAGLSPRPPWLAETLGWAANLLVPVRRLAGGPLVGRQAARALMLTGTVHDGARLHPDDARIILGASARALRLREGIATVTAADLRPMLGRLAAPPGLVWGERDLTIPVDGLDTVRALRPDAPARTLPNTGHVPMLEAPAAFADALEYVLASITAL
ncbi:MAG TPA: alpha/beta fold hydrolase [Solirubrobacteraceae bacterium]|nr:alpha/beta fold hydrolase [Solirubrobacteraceae bacterium]